MHRRALLTTTASFGTLALLAGCGTSSSTTPLTTQLQNALTVAQTVDQALIQIVNDITNPPISLITPDTQTTLLAGLTTVGIGISALLNQTPPPAGASTVAQIDGWFTIALNTAAPVLAVVLPAAQPVILALEAVDALLPVFEAVIPGAAAVAEARATTGRMRIHAATVAANLSPDQALAVLKTYLKGK